MSNPVAYTLRAQGIEHFDRKEYSFALACFDRLLCDDPMDRDIHNYKARALEGLGRNEEALASINAALSLDPKNVSEHCNRALLLGKLSRREDALASYDRALTLAPGSTDVLVKRAYLLHQLGRKAEAFQSADEAVKSAPKDLTALNTRGMICDDLERREEALSDFLAVLSLDPDNSEAITNRGIIHGRSGEFLHALECYERSLSLNPHQLNAFYNRACVRLVLGDWRQGFRDFECRWKLFPHEASRLTRLAPMWAGQDLRGKRILLHHEQGFGDTLQFSRYAVLVQQRGADVVMAVPAGLKRLMQSLNGSPQIVSEGEPIPSHDYHCPLMSLPMVFGTTPQQIPAPVSYLTAEAARVSQWQSRLGDSSRPRIGVVWSGRRYPPINYPRDMSLQQLLPLFRLDADFVCLHAELSPEEETLLGDFPNVSTWCSLLNDFSDTAALIQVLDLVIAVDTAVAHLAGALGKPVWLMNRYASCWRWLLDREDSPWYPTMRIFRQPSLGDWASVVQKIVQAATDYFAEKHSAMTCDLASRLQQCLDLHHAQQLEAAIAGYKSILISFPEQFDTLHYLGVALAQANHQDSALVYLARAQAVKPTDASVNNHLGNVLTGLGRPAEAIERYRQAIALDSARPDCHFNCGVAWMALVRPDEALKCYDNAIARDPNYAQAHNNRAILLADMHRVDEALESYDRAIAVQPRLIDAWINRSHLLRGLHRYEDALKDAEAAVTIDPNHCDAHNSRGAALSDNGNLEEALVSYDRAIELDATRAEPKWNKALVKLSQGDFTEGFRLYEARWGVKSLKLTKRFPDQSLWQGSEPLKGKTVLLHAEQGYGDTIQFCRFAGQVRQIGARVILSVPHPLKSLLRFSLGVELVNQAATVDFDLHCPLLSLPRALTTTLANIPESAGYLRPAEETRRAWATRLNITNDQPNVGLVWSGRATHTRDAARSMSFSTLLPILNHRIRCFGLQKDIRPPDVEPIVDSPIENVGGVLQDFADTAAVIANLDLVITVDTSVAHLAGAMGKPVWILLPCVADWRWLRAREDSPWYDSARLFRQLVPGDWSPVVQQVSEALSAHFPVSPGHKGTSKNSRIVRLRPRASKN